jgi:hypothetical protein
MLQNILAHSIWLPNSITPKSKARSIFFTPHRRFEFNRMLFKLKTALATFNRCMDSVLPGLQGVDIFVYADDVFIYADSFNDHSRKLATFLTRCDMQQSIRN